MWAQQPVQCTLQQKNLSLEGYTVSNTGQRLGITGSKKSLAWRALTELDAKAKDYEDMRKTAKP